MQKFFLYGFLVAGPNWKASIGTALLIAAPAGIYLAFVAPYMGLHVHIVILVIRYAAAGKHLVALSIHNLYSSSTLRSAP